MRYLSTMLACLVALTVLPAQAQIPGKKSTDSPRWAIHLHLQKTFASPLGKRLVEIVEKENPDGLSNFVKFAEAIGLDPRTDIGEIALFGDGFEETDATFIAELGQSTGNLEGWILAAPGYRSEDIDDSTQLHSMLVEGQSERAWFALPKYEDSGKYVLVGSLNRERTLRLSDNVLTGSDALAPNPLTGDAILSFNVNDLSGLPMDIDENKPGSAVIKMIERFALNIASNDNQLDIEVDIRASSPNKAKQISQLLTGLKALLQLADDYEVQKFASLLEDVSISHYDGLSQVQAKLSAPYESLEELLRDIENKKRNLHDDLELPRR